MGYSQSPRSSLDNASTSESLPLYTDLQVTSNDPLTAPQPRATPDEVRDFLVNLLTKTRSLHIDEARRVAAKWTKGTGRELSSYPPLLFAEIFGYEEGWMVYKEAHLLIAQEKKAKEFKYKTPIAILIMLVVEIGAILLILACANNKVGFGWILPGVMVCLFNGFALLLTTAMFFFEASMEDQIETRLRNGLTEARKPGS